MFAITAGAFVPLNFMAVRAAQSLVHPRTFGTVDGGLPGDMWLTFLVCFAGIALLWVTLVSFELTAKRTRGQLSRLRRALDDGDRLRLARPGSPAGSPRAARELALMPALPLDEAGKYVAAAYVVFVVLLLVYIGIMAAKLGRISREIEEIAELAERSSDADAGAAAAEPAAEAEEVPLVSDLLALGISHKTAPLELRERLALTEGRAAGVLNDLRSHEQVSEAAAISTCNRTELYLVVTDPVEAENLALGALSRQAGIRPTELIESLYSYRGIDAARHLYRVAAGLDSMIVGEAEIQGQVKRAYELALVEGATGRDPQPAVPRRARRRQAGPRRDPDRRGRHQRPLGRGRARHPDARRSRPAATCC